MGSPSRERRESEVESKLEVMTAPTPRAFASAANVFFAAARPRQVRDFGDLEQAAHAHRAREAELERVAVVAVQRAGLGRGQGACQRRPCHEVAVETLEVVHAPERWTALTKDPAALASVLDEEAAGLVDELDAIDRSRDADALEHLEAEIQARRELGLYEGESTEEGARARIEALRRDRIALEARFERR